MALPQRSPAADNQSKRFALALVCKYTSRLSAHMILLLRLNYQKFPQIFRGKSRQKLVHLFPLRVLAIGLGIAATKRDCRIAQSTGCTRPALRASPMRGCTPEQIKAITVHKTLSEVARYTKAADQERNAKQLLANLLRSESEPACQPLTLGWTNLEKSNCITLV